MIVAPPSAAARVPRTLAIDCDLVVVGGGLAGVCCAVTAAREGLRVTLVQDRPVLGGNASSEVRLWILGATSHLGNNNRWSREGGVVNEILEENLYRNRQGNPYLLDAILLEKCLAEERLTLLLDTVVHEVEKDGAEAIVGLFAFCPQNSTRYELRAPYFCDASGDGIVGFLAGAAFRMGAEGREEFDEAFAPAEEYGHLLGHSMYFYTKDVGVPVKFTRPAWALEDISRIPRYRQLRTNMQGCQLWWLEYGGRLDTIHDCQDIKLELWRVIYGVWDYFKNSGTFPEAETLTLEWVGHIPGKRESRRFEGDYILNQRDLVARTRFDDVVAHGGWAMDLHPADGIYSELSGCTQWHAKGVYGIPYRCFYSRNIDNLFLAGRIISASHVAFGSTRVMATCGAGGQAVGMAASICRESGRLPRELASGDGLALLQERLQASGQFLPGKLLAETADLTAQARVSASSSLALARIPGCDDWLSLARGRGMWLPFPVGSQPAIEIQIDAAESGTLTLELWAPSGAGEFTPETMLERLELLVAAGVSTVRAEFRNPLTRAGYHMIKLAENPALQVRASHQRITGILSVAATWNPSVATTAYQEPPADIGIDRFEFWLPERRPGGQNIALAIEPALQCFGPENVLGGHSRPTDAPNAWVADPADPQPELWLEWDQPQSLATVVIEFDPDWDHPMESVLMTHPEEVGPFMVKDFDLIGEDGKVLHSVRDHHSARFLWRPQSALKTTRLGIRILATHGAPAAVFRVRCGG